MGATEVSSAPLRRVSSVVKRELFREGCATSEDIYWKLDALHTFVIDLNWPEEEFRKYLNVRMKSLTSDMILKVASRSVLSCCIFYNHVISF